MAVNYTQEMVDLMKDRYSAKPTRETVEELAQELDKSIKSVIGKLSREGIYLKSEYLTKTGEKPITTRVIALAKYKEIPFREKTITIKIGITKA